MINAAGRNIPDDILKAYGKQGFQGSYARDDCSYHKAAPTVRSYTDPLRPKLVSSLREACERCGLRDGMVLSFHHHFRDGDYIVNMVMEVVKELGVKDITIAKKMVEAETIEAVMTRIPGTWGDEARYIWINKHDAMEIHDGKTILSYLDKNKPYDLYDKNNNKVGQIRGAELFKNHYSSVDKSVRKKYEKTIKTPTLDKRKSR